MDQPITSRRTARTRSPAVESLLAEIAGLDVADGYTRMMPAGCYTKPDFFDFE